MPPDSDDHYWPHAEHPIRHVDLMRTQLGRQSTGKFAILAPVFGLVGHPRRHRLVPGIPAEGIAMPLRLDISNLAQNAFLDHLPCRLIIVTVAALQPYLQSLLGMFPGELPQRVNLFRLEHQALLAEYV